MIRRVIAVLALAAAMLVGTASTANAARLCVVVDWYFSDSSSRFCMPMVAD
jgi:hypothetical protein